MVKAKFVIGDYPILFESTPRTFDDLGYLSYMMALSSDRIYSVTKNMLGEFTALDTYYYNYMIFHQSKRYVCSGNLELLTKSVQY